MRERCGRRCTGTILGAGREPRDGRDLLPESLDHPAFFDDILGPYPFREDRYGVIQTPHLGMEHQTIIAYGTDVRDGSMTRGNDRGFDGLYRNEASHEWWGILVTNFDGSDMWLHEGFGSCMQPLYLERRQGPEQYVEYMRANRRGIRNEQAVAPRRMMSEGDVYNGDIYAKGPWSLLGDETFFEVYLRQPALPEIVARRVGDRVTLHRKVPGDLPFPMPVDVRIGDAVEHVELSS